MFRTIYFTKPILTNKVRLDQLEGARDIAFRIELLGLDMTTRNLFDNPQQGRYFNKGRRRYCNPLEQDDFFFLLKILFMKVRTKLHFGVDMVNLTFQVNMFIHY